MLEVGLFLFSLLFVCLQICIYFACLLKFVIFSLTISMNLTIIIIIVSIINIIVVIISIYLFFIINCHNNNSNKNNNNKKSVIIRFILYS